MKWPSKAARAWVGCLILGAIAACGSGDPPTAESAWRPAADSLSQSQAERRATRVSDVTYELKLDLVESEDSYSGEVRIDLTLAGHNEPLSIDFSGGIVDEMLVNGIAVEPDYNGFFITLRPGLLEEGRNRIEIAYRHDYSADGNGLYRFVDPEDGKTYLYTYLWPYYANRLFPCFDQPDLRASFGLVVRAPAEWVVVSTASESTVLEFSDDTGEQKLWRFPKTPRFSTYIFSLYAGPYRIWEANAGTVPLRLVARQSMVPYVDVEAWLELTKRGLEFYEAYFDIPYPFGKLDQVIVPDFNISGMENVAAISYAEFVLPRGEPTHQQRERLALLILHEMAHMWFGDLVTMKWWNGLWLNESFATYMSYAAAAEASEFKDAWHRFFLYSKRSAYRADQRVTTHPIEVSVPDTESFHTVFDSITYGKGASVLKQLVHTLGEETFRLGVSAYLKKHAYGNTTLEDFTDSLAEEADKDVDGWVDAWLHRAGVNTVTVSRECDGGVLEELSISQTAAAELPTLREHRLQLGLYRLDRESRLRALERVPLTVSGSETVVDEARGKPCPTLVYPNLDDWGYVKIGHGSRTLMLAAMHVSELQDPLQRSMLWHDLWEAVRDSELTLAAFAAVAIQQVRKETNVKVIDQVLEALTDTLAHLNRMKLADTLDTYLPRIEELAWSKALAATPGGDLQRTWLDGYVGVAQSPEALARLHALLEGTVSLKGLEVDQDRRWAIITRLNAGAHPGSREARERERQRDGSAAGYKQAIAADAARPEIGTKRKWLDEFLDPRSEYSFSEQRAAMRSLFPSQQTPIHAELHAAILEALPELSAERDHYFLSSYTRELLRPICSEDSIARLRDALQGGDELNATVTKFLLEADEEEERCVELAEFNREAEQASR